MCNSIPPLAFLPSRALIPMADWYGMLGRILSMRISSLNFIPPPSPPFFGISSSSLSTMLQTIEYRLSVMPEPYKSAPTPEDISIEEIEARATAEEHYAEAVAKHAAWKEAKVAVEQDENLRLAREAQAVKVEALKQKAEEKRKAEKRQQEEELLHLLKEQEDAAERKRLADLKAKEDADATQRLKEQTEATE